MSKSVEANKDISWAIVGLGNPGKEYEKTRHNVGFCVIDAICSYLSLDVCKDKYLDADVAIYNGQHNNAPYRIIVAKPLRYMNNSGVVVQNIIERFVIPIDQCIVITDNVDMGVAQLRFRVKKTKGSTHNGIRSILSHVKSGNFPRLYVGIGCNRPQQSLSSYVLGKWHSSENKEYETAFAIAAKHLVSIPYTDILQVQRELNNY